MKVLISHNVADRWGAELAGAAPAAEWVRIEADGSISGNPDEAEVGLFSLDLTHDPKLRVAVRPLLEARSLRWLQWPGAGVDHPVFDRLLERGVRVTNASGIHAEPIAQYVFAYVLHWERNVARHQQQQRERHWEQIVSGDLTQKTIGIVGLGGIGLAVARVARAFGMRVVATRRTPGEAPNVDALLPPERLPQLLAESHFVLLAVPYNDATRGLIGAPELTAMRDDVVLINVARGPVVDTDALVAALREDEIRGATLDVTDPEPLPEDSPLWSLPNCVITPHDSGPSPRGLERLTALFVENLGRWVRGEPLINEVTETGIDR